MAKSNKEKQKDLRDRRRLEKWKKIWTPFELIEEVEVRIKDYLNSKKTKDTK